MKFTIDGKKDDEGLSDDRIIVDNMTWKVFKKDYKFKNDQEFRESEIYENFKPKEQALICALICEQKR